MTALIEDLRHPKEGSSPLQYSALYSRNIWQQYLICVWKSSICYWRTPHYNAVRLGFTVIFAFVIGSVYYRLGPKR